LTNPRKSRPAKQSWLRRAFRWTLRLLLGLVAFCILSLLALRWIDPPFTAVHVQRRVEAALSHRAYRKLYVFISLNRISRDLQHAVIAAEDGRFYQHHGIDWLELRKVVADSLEEGKVERGGSTITQQLMKNLFLTTQGSFVRKIAEFGLAPLSEVLLGKRRILELYLNVIEWGPGVYGAEAAARQYYGVSASLVGREQGARLAAIIPSPRRRRLARMNNYTAEILERMSRMGW
jgi:monofunctional biosynthetic peptidoglycan transglycosylase